MIKKLNYHEFCDEMRKFNAKNNITTQTGNKTLLGVVVFTADSFSKSFSEAQRSYMTDNLQKVFFSSMISNSIFADCLDGSDIGVRLDWYMHDKNPWKVDYCYVIEDFHVVKTSKESSAELLISLYEALCLTEGRGYWKAGTVAQMLAEGQEVQTPFAIYKKASESH